MLTPSDVALRLAARAWVEHPALPGRTNHLRAGVAVPLRFGPQGGVEAWCTLRPRGLRRHGGEISFPGGGPEAQDVDLEATARRELMEEVGVPAARALGRLSSVPVFTSEWRLEPFVLELADGDPRPDPVEVERVYALPLDPYLRGAPVEGLRVDRFGAEVVMPLFRVDGLVIFGATAIVLWELLEALCGARPPLEAGDLRWADVLADRAWVARDPGWAQRDR
jgi:8-oxo-dGTP pyrophosphatase MutT (NUDIX family)